MNILFDNFKIFNALDVYQDNDTHLNSKKEITENYLNKIFKSNSYFLDIYMCIRKNNITSDNKLIINKLSHYIDDGFKSTNLIRSIHNIDKKLQKLNTLFKYEYKNNKLFFCNFLQIFYDKIIENIDIIEKKIIKNININKNAFDAFNIIFNYFFNEDTNEIIYYYDIKYGIKILIAFKKVIVEKFKSIKNETYTNLVHDISLIKIYITYFDKVLKQLNTNFIKNKEMITQMFSSLENSLKLLPIINIYNSLDSNIVDETYYDIISVYIEYVNDENITNYIYKIIDQVKNNVLIIPEKLSSERLFIEISRTFRTYNKMYIFWKKEQYQLRIKYQIDEILNEYNLQNYIAMSILIFSSKLDTKNNTIIIELVTNIISGIVISNKVSSFLEILYYTLHNYTVKNKISDLFLDYFNIIMSYFPKDKLYYNKINRIINEFEINKDYNNEFKKVNIKCNPKDQNIVNKMDQDIVNTIVINKNTNINYELNLPKDILIYFKAYEQYYYKKHNFRKINWSIENSIIEIECTNKNKDKYTITGSIIPIAILIIISTFKNNITTLHSILVINKHEKTIQNINFWIEKLIECNIIKLIDDMYELENLTQNHDLTYFLTTNYTSIIANINDFDIDNTTDCYIIKTVKHLLDGIYINNLLETINIENKYFQIDMTYLNKRLDILISKSYIIKDNDIIKYDV